MTAKTRHMDFHTLLQGRRSIRRFLPDGIPESVVERLLEAAALAPSAHNSQPWRFVVLSDADSRRELQDAMHNQYRDDLVRDDVEEHEIERILRRSKTVFSGAPLVVLLCMSMEDMHSYPDAGRSRAERTMAVQSTALAGGHLLLAAEAEGLGSCWMCSPLFSEKAVRSVLDLPMDWEPQALILLGYPAGAPGRKKLKSLEELVLWR